MPSANKVYILIAVLILSLTPVVFSTLTTHKITATDWYRPVFGHEMMIRHYIAGDMSPLASYPPLFHMLMLPFVAFDFDMVYFQIIFAFLNTAAIGIFFLKNEGFDSTLLLLMLMATSIAWIQIDSALMPQAIDTIILMVTLHYYLKGKTWPIIGVAALMLTHLAGLIFFAVFLAHSLMTKRYRFAFCLVVLLAIMLMPYFIWLTAEPYEGYDYTQQLAYEAQYVTPFWKFFALSGPMCWLLLPYALYRKKLNLSDTQKFYVLWALMFVPLVFADYGLWRMISFSIVPLSMLAASILGEKK